MHVEQQLADIQEVVADILTMAKAKGADSAEASISKVQGIAVATRLKEVETVEFTNDGGLGISVYVEGCKGSASTADLSKQALALTVEKAIQIARYTGEDPCAGLAEKELMVQDSMDLELYHPVDLDTDAGLKLALEAETAALDSDPRINNSDGASYNANIGMKVYGNSHGINVGYPSSRYSLSCVMIAGDGDDMQRDYAYTVSREADKLQSAKEVGQQAAQNTLNRLGARKVQTCNVPVIIDKELAPSFIGHFVSAISGGSLYRKSSFLLDSKGQQVFPEWFEIQERPHIKRALASSFFDNEGVATHDMDIVTNGILNHYLFTSYSARKMGTKTNGHAGGIHNWLVKDTGHSQAQLLKDMGTGLLVTELMGQGVNIVTGDYSRGAAGYWVENGVIQYPVHELTIAGNLKDILRNIVAVGTDTELRGSIFTGSLLLESMAVAGE
ncbi:metalloprotease PmbA [Planctobacterium marinum]|uniref:metalloprotease PmbA n=1 Tax=Planctobacterium marinum TaxID=1631968 RepID=UPI001E35A47D|nr:metalloprotease PmbA [Planctobacterium marinum]MCC2608042.1 metalloprotease PmbA [Planctobacterium marinum]